MRAAIFLIALAAPALAIAAPPVPLDRRNDETARIPVEVMVEIPRLTTAADDPAEMDKEREAVSAALRERLKSQTDKTRQASGLNDLLYRDTDPRPVADKAPPEALKPNVADEPSVRRAIPGFQLIEKTKVEK